MLVFFNCFLISSLLRLARQREQYLQDKRFDEDHYRDALNAQVSRLESIELSSIDSVDPVQRLVRSNPY